METKKNVYEKLQEARVQLQNKNLKKTGKNKFANFDYYELADFMPSVNEIFNNLGLFSRFNIRDEIAYLDILNTENIQEEITFQSPVAEAEIKGTTPIQCLGGVHTYMKRYLYQNALEITESDMFDAKVGDKKDPLVEKKKESKVVEQKKETNYRDLLVDYCKKNNLDMNEIATKYKINAKSTNKDFEKVYFDLTLDKTDDYLGNDYTIVLDGDR